MKKLFKNLDEIKKVMNSDDWWTEYFVRPFSLRLVALIQDTNITPNHITLFSFIFLLMGCLFILTGRHEGYIIAAIFLHMSYILDIADGMLARYKKIFSPFGGWMDGISDRIGEFLILFCLTVQLGAVTINTLLIGMFSLFLLAMYHGYINKNLPQVVKTNTANKPTGKLTFLNKIRHNIKFGFFNLGEQFFLYTLFLLLNRIKLFFVVFCIYGTLSLISYSLLKIREYYQQSSHEK